MRVDPARLASFAAPLRETAAAVSAGWPLPA
jgi:hypothetical protein